MTLDEAIRHAEEVAEEQMESAKIWERYPESKYEHHLARKAYNSCKECAEEHRQLAEWLKDYKQLREQTRWISVSERLPKHYDSHDLIHRETARRIIDSPRTKEQMLMVLDSAENQKKTGHWIYEPRKRLINETDEGREYITEYWCKCSECGGDFGFQKMSDAYCKYCGARMVKKVRNEYV